MLDKLNWIKDEEEEEKVKDESRLGDMAVLQENAAQNLERGVYRGKKALFSPVTHSFTA